MTVRFILERDPGDPRRFDAGGTYVIDVEYGWPGSVPRVGERIEPDGSDPDFPEGVYLVKRVSWEITIRGPRRAIVELTE